MIEAGGEGDSRIGLRNRLGRQPIEPGQSLVERLLAWRVPCQLVADPDKRLLHVPRENRFGRPAHLPALAFGGAAGTWLRLCALWCCPALYLCVASVYPRVPECMR